MRDRSFLCLAKFQFHKGTIRTSMLLHSDFYLLYFNSIKVRLELNIISRKKSSRKFQFHKGTIRTISLFCLFPWWLPFQFHKGTIRTVNSATGVFSVAKFQFHKGTIRTLHQLAKGLLIDDFNSIKVRLELRWSTSSCIRSIFQFHKGTIRTGRIFSQICFSLISIP